MPRAALPNDRAQLGAFWRRGGKTRPFSLPCRLRLLIDERSPPAIHRQLLAVLDHFAFFALQRALVARPLAGELRQVGSAVGVQPLEVEIELGARPVAHAELA